MGKNGQVAMEFLMTYGWAILIILIAIGALWLLGVFSPSTPSNCQVEAPFSCGDSFIGETGVMLQLAVSSSVSSASIGSISINGEECPNVIGELKPGRESQILCEGIQLEEGESVSATFEGSYRRPGGFNQPVEGSITGEATKSLTSCKDHGGPSGYYLINPTGDEEVTAYCDMETDEGGWTLVALCKKNDLGPDGKSACWNGNKVGNTPSPSDTSSSKLSDENIMELLKAGDKITRGHWRQENRWGSPGPVSAAIFNKISNPDSWSSASCGASGNEFFVKQASQGGIVEDMKTLSAQAYALGWGSAILTQSTGCACPSNGLSNARGESCGEAAWYAGCENGPSMSHMCAGGLEERADLLIWAR